MFSWKRNRNLKKNRRRFEEIVSDSRHNHLESIFKGFKEGRELSDGEVIEAYHKFSSEIQTNTISAAELEFVIVATIAVNKPNLSIRLLAQPLLMLVWSFGDKITSETVVQFVNGYILNDKAEPYGGIPGSKAVNWLKDYFKNNYKVVQRKLDEVIDENNKELLKI